MPLKIKWSTFTKEEVSKEKNELGVYEIGNDKGILYIGEGKVKDGLMGHFAGGALPIVGASYYRVEFTKAKERSGERKNAELEKYKKQNKEYPHFNQRKS
jgi:hypothetical protein